MARTVDGERVARVTPPMAAPAIDHRALLLEHALDRLIAAVGLLVTAPVIGAVALALRLRGGPVPYREPRVGEHGRPLIVRTFAVPDGSRLAATGVPRCRSCGAS